MPKIAVSNPAVIFMAGLYLTYHPHAVYDSHGILSL
jgi:hypothetical protein